MGPIRGFKRRKKAEKKVDQNVFDAASASALSSLQPQSQRPLDWWDDDFSKRITGTHNTFFVFLLCFFSYSFSFHLR
jgi:hypothetical protein